MKGKEEGGREKRSVSIRTSGVAPKVRGVGFEPTKAFATGFPIIFEVLSLTRNPSASRPFDL